MTLQLPAEAHDTPKSSAPGFDPASLGKPALTPADQRPEDSLRSSPWPLPDASLYEPTALQFPTETQETEVTSAAGSGPASGGKGALVPADQWPEDSCTSIPCERFEVSW